MMGWNNCDICNYSKHISWIFLAGKVFIFDEITGNIYLLKDIEKEFWLSIDGEKNVNDLIMENQNNTSLSMKEIRTLLDKFLQKMDSR